MNEMIITYIYSVYSIIL